MITQTYLKTTPQLTGATAASIDPQLVKLLILRAHALMEIKCYGEAKCVLDFLHSQIELGITT